MKKPAFASWLLVIAASAALSGCAENALAARLVDVVVVDRTSNQRLPVYRHAGSTYVVGTPGERYALELRSRGGERLLTVVSVDGVNVLTGQSAAPLQSGYVLETGQRYGLSGWRKSLDEVAQFYFTDLSNSYAARTGRPANVGVIGVAVYRERLPERPAVAASPAVPRGEAQDERAGEQPQSALGRRQSDIAAAERDADASSRQSAAGAADASGVERRSLSPLPGEAKKSAPLGTGHGEREYAPTRYTQFLRASDVPDEVITIYYDSRANLIARGIIPTPPLRRPPQAFPEAPGFVPDPRG